MKTIAVISQKGGAGKTTLVLNLAVAATRARKSTVVIDLDPQASAADWGDSREKETPVVVSAQSSRLTPVLQAAEKEGAKLAIIDTAPHSESAALAATRAANLVLIPCRPAILDLRAISNTVDLIKLAKKKGYVVLNAVPTRGLLAEEATEAIAEYDIEVLPIRIGQRAAFIHSLTAGKTALEYEPTGKAAREIKQLYKFMCKLLNM